MFLCKMSNILIIFCFIFVSCVFLHGNDTLSPKNFRYDKNYPKSVKQQARRERGGGPGGLVPPPFLVRSVNPISTKGGTFSPPSITCPPQIFRPCNGPEQYIFLPSFSITAILNFEQECQIHQTILQKSSFYAVLILSQWLLGALPLLESLKCLQCHLVV